MSSRGFDPATHRKYYGAEWDKMLEGGLDAGERDRIAAQLDTTAGARPSLGSPAATRVTSGGQHASVAQLELAAHLVTLTERFMEMEAGHLDLVNHISSLTGKSPANAGGGSGDKPKGAEEPKPDKPPGG